METNVLLSDFSDEAVDAGKAVDAGIFTAMRATFGISGSPVQK
jgi:hypothetical protein